MGSLLSRVVLGASVASAVMVQPPTVAEAQPGPSAPAPSPADKQAAKKFVDDANAAFEAKDYDKAIELYKKAFALVSHPLLLFNVAQAHRLAGRPEQALPLYERYLQLEPDGSQAPAARAAIAELKKAGVTRKPPEAKPVDATPPAAAPPSETRPVEITRPVESKPETGAPPSSSGDAPPAAGAPTPAQEPEVSPRVDTGDSPQALKITGLALGGAGIVSVAIGVYFTTRVLAAEDDAREVTDESVLADITERGESAERRGDIAYLFAGSLVVAGAVTYYIGHRRSRSVPTTALAPIVGPGFAGLTFSGSLR